MTILGSCKSHLSPGKGYGFRNLSHFRVVEHIVPASYGRTYPGAIEPGAETSLKLAVKQYIPHQLPMQMYEPTAVTIIASHANGFPKELYEPLWDDLYEFLARHYHSIRNIWIADIVPQGQSGKLNAPFLGNDPNWWDHTRDLLFFINQKQSQMPQPLVGIGHSMGGSILAALALLHPTLFQTLILLDPVIQTENPSKSFTAPSTYRRDRWPSRLAAGEAFRRSKFYQAWDERVLDQWLNHGITSDVSEDHANNVCHSSQVPPLPSRDAALHDAEHEAGRALTASDQTQVTLTTTKAQEVFHYLRPLYKGQSLSSDARRRIYPDINPMDLEKGYDFYRPEPAEIFRRLPNLHPSVLYCFGQSSPLATPELRRKKLDTTGIGPGGSGGVASQLVKEAVFKAGHMLPFEQPRLCAQPMAEWLGAEIDRWCEGDEEWRQLWAGTETKQDIDEDWLNRIPKPSRPPKPG